jgi:DNA repair protein RecN (Recombination protein N)
LQVLLPPNVQAQTETESEATEVETDARAFLPAGIRASGAESVEICFSANPELEARPLKECASGGEISRVMLALKGVLARVSGADRLPVVIFDEIDAGVGGRLGAVMGKKLGELAKVRQVLCVTHQPQIAAFASRQLKVEKLRKDGISVVCVEPVEGDRRVDELALMLRGSEASAHTRAEAAAMLKEARAIDCPVTVRRKHAAQ